MARQINRLDPSKQRTLTKPGRYADGDGLYLSISPGGRRWVFLYRWRRKRIEMGLGSARPGQVTLAQARKLATQARASLADGLDPRQARQPASSKTFGELADDLIGDWSKGWKNQKHCDQWRMTVLGVLPDGSSAENDYCRILRPIPVADVTIDHVHAVLRHIWKEKPETASRIRGRIERVMAAAKAKNLRTGDNPARWKDGLEPLLGDHGNGNDVEHHAAMPFEDIPAFMARLRALTSVSARALEFTILCAARTGETIGATWQEIDVDKAKWTIPGTRMKMGKLHIVPLTPRALEIIAEMKKITRGKYVFNGAKAGRSLSNMAMAETLKHLATGCTVHGMRSAFKDWASETTSFANIVSEAALAHTIKDKAERAYRRGTLYDKRCELMQAWADYCLSKLLG